MIRNYLTKVLAVRTALSLTMQRQPEPECWWAISDDSDAGRPA